MNTKAWLDMPAILAMLAYLVAMLPSKYDPRTSRTALLVGWAAHAVAIVVDVLGYGEQPAGARFGFATALSATAWLVLGVYAVESRFVPIERVRRWLALCGAAVVVLALVFPGEVVAPHAPWAPVHWLLGFVSYGLFGAAVLHAGMLNAADRQMRGRAGATVPAGLPLLRLERLTFQFVAAGFTALTITLLLGWSLTTTWHWDHKNLLSVLSWIVFAGLLAGRQRFGWRGRRATRWLYAGAALLLLAYVGSRFVFEVLLHRPVPMS